VYVNRVRPRTIYGRFVEALEAKGKAALIGEYQSPTTNSPKRTRTNNWEKSIRPALFAYLKMCGDLLVPRHFIVPGPSEKWPEPCWGLKLGQVVESIRRGKYAKVIAREPDLHLNLRFSGQNQTATDRKWRNNILPALVAYRNNFGDLFVQQSFVVPEDSPKWPKGTEGLRLGQVVSRIRQGKFADQIKRDRKLLDDMGFIWKVWTMRIGYSKGGAMVIPDNSFERPDGAWSTDLADVVNTIGKETYDEMIKRDEELLASPGSSEKISAANTKWESKMLPALQAYKRIYGDLLVQQSFVVPEDSLQWPRGTEGLKLGQVVSRIRQGKYAKQVAHSRALLDDMGFVWKFWTVCMGHFHGRWSCKVMKGHSSSI